MTKPHTKINASSSIVLSTLNARYIHSAFGLRYLQANLGEYQAQSQIIEFTIDTRPDDIVEKILARQPTLVGFGVYIWNIVQTEQVVSLLKAIAPQITIVLGGPEVSYELESQTIIDHADHIITGWGDVSFRELVAALDAGESPSKIISGRQAKLQDIQMPYALYTEADIANRVMYVEASRGCPFKCEFCLSALDKTAWPFDLDLFLDEMDRLHKRGARHFKFVDRTFNLKIKNSLRILEFFLERMSDDLFLHFEVVPDHLPEALKEMIQRFPPGSLQFEIGIQTFNPQVQQRISRRQDNDKAKANLEWIKQNTNAYIHADLIFGLPGESLESFAQSFNTLVDLAPHEVQLGILKRLKGSPIIRHTQAHQLVFSPNPPFAIVSSDQLTYSQVQIMTRFARYWDLIANSGRFKNSLPLILANESNTESQTPFFRFEHLSREIFARTEQTHKIALNRLFDLVFDIGSEVLDINAQLLTNAIEEDFLESGQKSYPKVLQRRQKEQKHHRKSQQKLSSSHKSRQARHY